MCFIISFGGFASGLAPNYYCLISLRAIVGFAIGGANIPFDLLAEFLPASHRGGFLIYIELFWTIGTLYVSSMAWAFLNSGGWRFLTFLVAIPVTITSFISVYYLPESPRWLLTKNRTEEAEKIVRDCALVNGITMPEFSLILDAVDERGEEEKDANYIELVATPHQRSITFPLWIVWAGFGFTYYGLILLVSRVYSIDTDDDDDDSSHNHKTCSFNYEDIFINATAEVVGICLSGFIIDRMGRVKAQLATYSGAALGVLLIGAGLPATGVVIVSMFGRAAIMSASNATWVMTPELYNTELRTVGHAAAVGLSKLGAFCAPYAVVSDLSIFSLGCIFATVNLCAAIAVCFLPETSGRKIGSFSSSNSTSSNEQLTLAGRTWVSFLVMLGKAPPVPTSNKSHIATVNNGGAQLEMNVVTNEIHSIVI